MTKRLTPVGNSLGLVLDKPILRMLGIGRSTPLRVRCDGVRVVIEPIFPTTSELVERRVGPIEPRESGELRDAPLPAAMQLDAPVVFEVLLDHGLERVFSRLHHSYTKWRSYLYWLNRDGVRTADAAERATVRRFAEALRLRRSGLSMEEAADEALRREPIADSDRPCPPVTAPDPGGTTPSCDPTSRGA